MGLATTTWGRRNIGELNELKTVAQERGIDEPSLLIVGPGGIVDWFHGCFPEGAKHNWDAFTKLRKFLVHQLESILRKTHFFNLKCYEVAEVLEILVELRPQVVSVVDLERKVVDAVQHEFNGKVDATVVDITQDEIPISADLVVCYNTIQRTVDHEAALNSVVTSLNPGGLLSLVVSSRVEFAFDQMGLEQLSPTLFSKSST